ncbi:hypothetical protein EDD85DRAFT_230051 [Armillaria nabsnona]|nr:hypothetical protein EDD85DRAFT_230051 [Armillaria nabsnona]
MIDASITTTQKPITDFIPPEIIDAVIDCLQDDKDALLACSFVCRLFRPRTRVHLFHTLDLIQWNVEYRSWKPLLPKGNRVHKGDKAPRRRLIPTHPALYQNPSLSPKHSLALPFVHLLSRPMAPPHPYLPSPRSDGS